MEGDPHAVEPAQLKRTFFVQMALIVICLGVIVSLLLWKGDAVLAGAACALIALLMNIPIRRAMATVGQAQELDPGTAGPRTRGRDVAEGRTVALTQLRWRSRVQVGGVIVYLGLAIAFLATVRPVIPVALLAAGLFLVMAAVHLRRLSRVRRRAVELTNGH